MFCYRWLLILFKREFTSYEEVKDRTLPAFCSLVKSRCKDFSIFKFAALKLSWVVLWLQRCSLKLHLAGGCR